MWADVVKLRAVTKQYVDGFLTEVATETEVFADRHGVVRAEYYAAQAAGMQADIAFTLRLAEYGGQSELAYGGKIYDVVRTYELDSERIDLTCRRR